MRRIESLPSGRALKFMPPESDFFLVIPAYDERRRLPLFLKDLVEALADAPFLSTVQIVEDGSSAETRSQLARALSSISGKGSVSLRPVLGQTPGRGKGRAIRMGWAGPSTAPWLGFVDADGAVPAAEVRRVLTRVYETGGENQAACFMATRTNRSGRVVRRRRLRNMAGRLFTFGINALFQTHFSDTQCGFKIVSRSAWNKISSGCVENGFSFDVELLVRLRQVQAIIREVGIDWEEKPGGHFHPAVDGWGTLWRAIRLRILLLVGR